MQKNDKIVILDWGMFIHRAGYASKNNPSIPVNYTVLNMVLSCLRKIGIDPFTQILIACDSRKNWRKSYDQNYKANRKELREKSGLDWKTMYAGFDELLGQLEKGTDWNIISVESVEADDIASTACRYFIDKEIILCSFDSDWEILWHYSNVKIFSPLIKYKGVKGSYKVKPENFNPYKILSKKILKEATDNLVNETLNAKEYENRMVIINLLELPEFIESQILEELKKLPEKYGDLDLVPYRKLREKLGNLYNDTKKIIDYEDCVKRELKKKKKKVKVTRRKK